MNWELFVGLRYLRSRRSETFVSVITVISTLGVLLGVMVMTITLSVMTGFEEDLRSRILGLHPHIQITDRLGGGMITDPELLVAAVVEDERVIDAAPVINSQVMVSDRGRLFGVYARGVDLLSSSSTEGIRSYVVEGSMDGLAVWHDYDGARLEGIVVGAELAGKLGLGLGDIVTLMVPSFSASPLGALPRSKRFVLTGLFDSGMVEYDSGLVYLSIDAARILLDTGSGVSGIEARVRDPYEAAEVASALNERLGLPYWASSWTDSHRNVFEALKLEKTVYFLVLLLIILVAAFNIVATLYMVVMEKRRDIAIMKTMGATNSSIAFIFVCKGMIIAAVGTGVGALLGYLACVGLDQYELIDLPEGVFYVSTLPVRILLTNFLAVVSASLALCLGACVFPAWKAVRVVPVDVLRYE
ncbi:MAG: FtsX-like permease family protein [Candidatus Binatia bacterium]